MNINNNYYNFSLFNYFKFHIILVWGNNTLFVQGLVVSVVWFGMLTFDRIDSF